MAISNRVLFIISLLTIYLSLLFSTPAHDAGGLPFSETETDRILVLTAHPDDECMFFGPGVVGLVGMGREVWGLCLSVGNADGLGEVRKRELVESYEVLGVGRDRVVVLDHPDLQDGMVEDWDPEVIAGIVLDFVRENDIRVILTFDQHGISSHPNHKALYRSSLSLPNVSWDRGQDLDLDLRIYSLHTVPLPLKFLSFLSPPSHLRLPFWNRSPTDPDPDSDSEPRCGPSRSRPITFVSGAGGYLRTLKAMTRHWSQLVWFRWLYVVFSRYMFRNEFREVFPCG